MPANKLRHAMRLSLFGFEYGLYNFWAMGADNFSRNVNEQSYVMRAGRAAATCLALSVDVPVHIGRCVIFVLGVLCGHKLVVVKITHNHHPIINSIVCYPNTR